MSAPTAPWTSAAALVTAALATGDGFDPFAAFSDATGASGGDPRTHWHGLLETAPLHEGTVPPPGGESMSDLMFGQGPVCTAVGYDAVNEVLRTPEVFSSSILGNTVGLVWGRTIIQMDEPEHARYRKLIQRAFTRKEMDRWEGIAVPNLHAFLDAIVDRGRGELVQDLLLSYPITVIADAIGLPREDVPLFFRLAVEMSIITLDPMRALTASQDLAAYLTGQIAARRAAPGPDLLTSLIEAELPAGEDGAGQKLTEDEIVSFIRLLLIAGAETTSRSSATLLMLLLAHPEQYAAIAADRSLIPAAIEEALRFEAPLTAAFRIASTDGELAGCPVPEGKAVISLLGAANRDPARWPNPDVFDIHREQRAHLSFSGGPHLCLGMHVARTEMRVVLEAALDRMPGLRLDPDAPAPVVTGRDLRSPARLDVVWDAT